MTDETESKIDYMMEDDRILMLYVGVLSGEDRRKFGENLSFALTHNYVHSNGMTRWLQEPPERGGWLWNLRKIIEVEVEQEVEDSTDFRHDAEADMLYGEMVDDALNDPNELMGYVNELRNSKRVRFGQFLRLLLTHYPVSHVNGVCWEHGKPIRGDYLYEMRSIIENAIRMSVDDTKK